MIGTRPRPLSSTPTALLGTSAAVITARTPSTARAAVTSTWRITPQATGERTMTPWSLPGSVQSSAYLRVPATFSEKSRCTRGAAGSAGGRSASSGRVSIAMRHRPLGVVDDGVEDLRVAGAAAEVAGEAGAELLPIERAVALEQPP